MNPKAIVSEIYQSAVDVREPYAALSDDEKRFADELMQRFEDAEATYGPLPNRDLLYPMLLSKTGRYKEAISLTMQQYELSPNWNTAVAAANAARRAGDMECAAEMFGVGSAYDPSDIACFLEVGDIRLEQDQCDQALAAYEQALQKDSTHQWALPSAFYCRHRIGIKGNWLASLREVANQEGCTCGLEGCLTSVFGGYGSGAGIARAEYLLRKIEGND